MKKIVLGIAVLTVGLGITLGGVAFADDNIGIKENNKNIKTIEDDKFKNNITKNEAQAIMLERAGGGKIVEFEFDSDDNQYEGKIIMGNAKYEIKVNANNGAVVECEAKLIKDNNIIEDDNDDLDDKDDNNITSSKHKISDEKAKEIMNNKVNGGKIVEFEFDSDDNEYEGKIIKDNKEYEIKINAESGSIKNIEVENIDNDD